MDTLPVADGSLPAARPREEVLDAATGAGFRRTLLPAVLATTVVAPMVYGWIFPALVGFLSLLPVPVGTALLVGLLFLSPILLALPVGLAAARVTEALAAEDPEAARAAGAGAGLCAATVTGAAVLGLAASAPVAPMALVWVPPALLGVGTVGAAAFRPLRARSGRDASVPVVYRGMGIMALTAFLGLLGLAGVEWLLSWAPGVGALRALLGASLPVGLDAALLNALKVAALTPLTLLGARWLRRRAPDVPAWVPALGMAAPMAVGLLVQLAFALSYPAYAVNLLLPTLVATSGAYLGLLPHLFVLRSLQRHPALGSGGPAPAALPEGS